MTQDPSDTPVSGSQTPTSGWYNDPENPTGPRRWWNGQSWTDEREPAEARAQARHEATAAHPSAADERHHAPNSTQDTPNASSDAVAASAPSPASPPVIPPEMAPAPPQPNRPAPSQPTSPRSPAPPTPHGASPPAPPSAPAATGQAPMAAPTGQPRGFPGIGQAFRYGFEALTKNLLSLLLIGFFGFGIPGTAVVVLSLRLMDGARFEDGTILFADSARITSAGAGMIIGGLLVLYAALAAYALVLDGYDSTGGRGAAAGSLGTALGRALVRLPAAIGWGLLIAIPVSIISGFLSLLLGLGGFGVVIAGLLMLILIPVEIYVVVRWLFFFGFGVADGPGSPFRRSANVSQNRWWKVFGFLAVIGLGTWFVGALLGQIPSAFMELNVVETQSPDGWDFTASMSTGGAIVTLFVYTAMFIISVGLLATCTVTLYRAGNPAAAHDGSAPSPAAPSVTQLGQYPPGANAPAQQYPGQQYPGHIPAGQPYPGQQQPPGQIVNRPPGF